MRKNWLNEEIKKVSNQQLKDRTKVISEDLELRGVRKVLARKKAREFAEKGLFKSDIDDLFKKGML